MTTIRIAFQVSSWIARQIVGQLFASFFARVVILSWYQL
jgi:hypothetical protein